MKIKLSGMLIASVLLTSCGGGSSSPVTPEPEQEDQANPFTPVENEPAQEPTETPEPVSEPEPTNELVVEPEPEEPTQDPVEGEDPVYSPDPIETVAVPVENPDPSVFDVINRSPASGGGENMIELNSVSTFNNKPTELKLTITSNLEFTSIGIFCGAHSFDEWGNFANFTTRRAGTDSWHALDVEPGDANEITIRFSNTVEYGIDFRFISINCIGQRTQGLSTQESFSRSFVLAN